MKMENSHKQSRNFSSSDKEDAAIIIEDGCINYFFPFSFLKHPAVEEVRGHLYQIASPRTYYNHISERIHQLCRLIPGISFGITWLPESGWRFSPWKFKKGDDLSLLTCESMAELITKGAVGDEDMIAMAACDGFFYLSEYLRRQPIVRLRLIKPTAVVRESDTSVVIDNVRIDLTLHLALGQGCLVFRHSLKDFPVDDLIGTRLTQFRRGMAFRWIKTGSEHSRPIELQDLYFSLGKEVFGSSFVPTYDVRQYAAVLELRRVRQGNRLLEYDFISESNPKWLYGLLNVDERWRDIDEGRVKESLSKTISHTKRYRQYFQSVTLMVLHSTDGLEPYRGYPASNPLDLYYQNLRSNLRRTVADRACVMEAQMAQENLLVNMHEDYRMQIWNRTPSRSTTQHLRKALFLSRQEADESFNILPGEELLSQVRGLSSWRQRIQEASATLDLLMEEYNKYHSEFMEDVGTSIGVGLSVFSVLFSLGTAAPISTRWGITLALAFLAISRSYKYKDRVSLGLMAIWLVVVVIFWIILDLLK